MAVIDFFDRGCGIDPDAEYLAFGAQRTSYREAQRFTHRVANGLLALGCGKEGKAAVWSANDPVGWLCTLSIWRAGMAWMPINPRNAADENGYLLDTFDCEVLFFQCAFAPQVAALRPRLKKVRQFICIDGEASGALALQQWAAAQPDRRPDVSPAAEDVCALMCTGGTTGKPKGVMISHRNLQTMVANWLSVLVYPADRPPVNLAAAPLTHTAGVFSLMTTLRGGKVVILPRPDPALLLDAIEQHRVTELFLPPTVIYGLLDLPGIGARDFSSLCYLLYGAAPMSPEKLRRALKTFGAVMIQGFGQTEATASISCLQREEHFVRGEFAPEARLASCGRPFPFTNVTIRDDANRELPGGEVGEICVAGDNVMKGYYRDPEATWAAFKDGWFLTGDLVRRDADGYYWFVARKKDIIRRRGENISGAELDRVMGEHPAVAEAAAIAVPSPLGEDDILAAIVLRPGMRASAREIADWCRARLAAHKVPRYVAFLDELPHTPTHRVAKFKLKGDGTLLARAVDLG